MTCLNLSKAINDRRFSGSKRLCWFAFGDGDGTTGVSSVMHWAGCDEAKALRLLDWFVQRGYADTDGSGIFKTDEFASEDFGDFPKSSKKTHRPKMEKYKRVNVLSRNGPQCTYCGDAVGPFHIDHVHPLSRGGSNKLENLTVACQSCNLSKGSKTVTEWENKNAQF